MRLTLGTTTAAALLFLPAGCIFMSQSYPCEADVHCPAPMVCAQGTCAMASAVPPRVDAGAAPADAGPAPTPVPDAGLEQPVEVVDAGASMAQDAGVPVPPVREDAGPSDAAPDAGAAPPPPPPEPIAPIATDSLVSTTAAVVVDLPILEGDADSWSILSAPRRGSLSPPVDGRTTYTPAPGYVGTDRFLWSASGPAGTSVAEVFIEVLAAAPAPAATVRLSALETPSDAPRAIVVDDTLLAGASTAAGFDVVDAATGLPVATNREATDDGAVLWLRSASDAPLVISLSDSAADGSADVFAGYEAVYHLADGADARGAASGVAQDTETAPGVVGDALRFDGASAWVNLGADLPLLVGAPGATVSAWVLPTSFDNDSILFAIATGDDSDGINASRLQIGMSASGRVEIRARASDGSESWRLQSAANTLTGEAWQHLVVTAHYADDDVDLYIDGAFVGLSTVDTNANQGGPYPPPPPVNSFSGSRTSMTSARHGAIGAQDVGNGGHFVGLIDELRVASVAMTEATIATLPLATQAAEVTAGPQVEVAASLIGQGELLLAPSGAPAPIYLVALAGQDARSATVASPDISFIPLSTCTQAPDVQLWWASASASVDSDIEVDAPGQVTAALLEVRDGVAATLAARTVGSEDGCGAVGATTSLVSAGRALDVLHPSAAATLPSDATVLIDVGELLVTSRAMAAGAVPVPIAPGGVMGGLMVGVR